MPTLLEQALQSANSAVRTKNIDNPQMEELALAWVNDKIRLKDIQEVLKLKVSGNAYPLLANALKKYIRRTNNE